MKPVNDLTADELRREWAEGLGLLLEVESMKNPYVVRDKSKTTVGYAMSIEQAFRWLPNPLTDLNAAFWGLEQVSNSVSVHTCEILGLSAWCCTIDGHKRTDLCQYGDTLAEAVTRATVQAMRERG